MIHFVVLGNVVERFALRYSEEKYTGSCKGKGKAIPLQALTGPEGSGRVRLQNFKKIGT
jgi:hypothetical protein